MRDSLLYSFNMKSLPEYNIWIKMKSRCYNSNDQAYHRYGGRGIHVCDKWKNSFMSFLSDMGLRPSKNHSIDRINNDGNYEPNNCRWVTQDVQMNNVSYNIKIPLPNGEIVKTREAIVQLGLNRNTLINRLRHNIPLDKPLRKVNTKYKYLDKELTVGQLATINGIKVRTITDRLSSGWDPFDAANIPVPIKSNYYYKDQLRSIPDIARLENVRVFNLRYHLGLGKNIYEAIEYIKDNENKKQRMKELLKDDRSIYNLWCRLRQIYRNPLHQEYKWFGGKGYLLCDIWYNCFFTFYKDISPCPGPSYKLKPIDKTLPFSKNNFEWVVK